MISFREPLYSPSERADEKWYFFARHLQHSLSIALSVFISSMKGNPHFGQNGSRMTFIEAQQSRQMLPA